VTDVRMMGVAKTIREDQIDRLTDAEQDALITDLGHALERELRDYVMDASPVGELVYQVQGPFDPAHGRLLYRDPNIGLSAADEPGGRVVADAEVHDIAYSSGRADPRFRNCACGTGAENGALLKERGVT